MKKTRKKATRPSPPADPPTTVDSTCTSWTTQDEAELIDFLQDHATQVGDGLNFKGPAWTGAVKVLAACRTIGAPKNALSCKNKYSSVCPLLCHVCFSTH